MPVTKCIRDALDDIATTVDAVTGIRAAYEDPPDSLNALPAAIVYVASGEWEFGPGALSKKGLHTIGLEIHHPRLRKDLARGVADAVGYAESVPNALMTDPTLGGSVDVINAIRYRFVPNSSYAGTDTMAWFYEIDVKIENSIT